MEEGGGGGTDCAVEATWQRLKAWKRLSENARVPGQNVEDDDPYDHPRMFTREAEAAIEEASRLDDK